jgi:histidine triad (HIT) family protein
MSCLFCSIVAGEAAATLVAQGESFFAFLDARPVFKGHVLVVPRRHIPTLLDLAQDETGSLFTAVKRVAGAVERGLGADGTFVAMNNKISQSVPHLHVHVVPRHRKDGLRGFFWPRVSYQSDEERNHFAARIAGALE